MLNYFALIMQKTIQSNLDAYYNQNGISNLPKGKKIKNTEYLFLQYFHRN